MAIPVLSTVEEVWEWRKKWAASSQSVALVPTMGFLHEGHVSLMREAKQRAPVVAVSIFVNPTQFGPKEDLARYPRDFEGDLTKCEQAGVSAVFAPSPEDMYPTGFQTFVDVAKLGLGLCGDRRPGHFRGVATIVTKLLALFRPEMAFFGEKDFQQLQVIRALSRDLHLGVDIVGMPTVREKDGLAMSSRNAYLSPAERARALSVWRGLSQAQALAQAGVRDVTALVQAVRDELKKGDVTEDYVELVEEATLAPMVQWQESTSKRLMVAGFVGKTRLIDNLAI